MEVVLIINLKHIQNKNPDQDTVCYGAVYRSDETDK